MAATNADILRAMSLFGADPGPVSLTGAQSLAFKTRVVNAMAGTPKRGVGVTGKQYASGKFAAAIAEAERKFDAAQQIANFKPEKGGSSETQFLGLLEKTGAISGAQHSAIFERLRQATKGMRAEAVSKDALMEAVGHELGWNHPAVALGVQKTGVKVTPRLQQFLDSASQYGPYDPKKFMWGDQAPPAGAVAPAPPAAQSAVPTGRTPNGEPTKNLQMLLNSRGAGLVVDGKYGPATAAAQQKYGTGSATTTTTSAAPGGTLGAALGAGGTTPGAAGPGAPALPPLRANASDAEVESHIRRHLGFAAWALDTPEVRGALVDFTRRMRGEDFTDEQLEQALMVTDWWREKSATQRQRVEEQHSDPGTYLEGIDADMEKLREDSLKYGLNLPDARLRQMAEQSYGMGWSDQERNAALAAEFDYDPSTGADTNAQIVTDLRGRAKHWLMPLSEATIDRWGQDIIAGKATFETFDQYAAGIAKTMFPIFAKNIESGQRVSDLVEPYKQQAARYLEIDPEAIDFTDPKWMRTLEANNPDGSRSQRGIADFADLIRTDSQYGWDKTRNAREHAAQLAADLGRQFGAV